ncbi:unnamed protein product [Closterium sp. NIES-54]
MVRCYTSPSAATLGRLALPFLFPELSDFTAEADLTSLLHSLDARSQAILLAENKPPYISLFTCSRLASLALFAPAHDVATSHGFPSLSFFEGCSSSLLAPSVASTATADLLSVEEVSTASAPSGRRRSRGGRTRGGDHGGGVGGSGGGGGGSGGDGGRGRHGGGGGGREGAERGGGGSGGSRGGVDGGAGPGSAPEGVVAASLCACESASTGAVPVEALHTLTLDSCVSRCFFRDCTIVTTLAAPDPVTLADPLFGPVVAHGTTILLCPTAPSGSLTGFHLPLFAMNLIVRKRGRDSTSGRDGSRGHDGSRGRVGSRDRFCSRGRDGSRGRDSKGGCVLSGGRVDSRGRDCSKGRNGSSGRNGNGGRDGSWGRDGSRGRDSSRGRVGSRGRDGRKGRRKKPYKFDTPLPTGHSLSAPPSDESVEPSGPYPELVGCLITSGMGLVLGGRARVVLTGHTDATWVDDLATQRLSQGYTFSLGSGSVS